MGTEGGGEGVDKESVVAVGCGFEILDVLYAMHCFTKIQLVFDLFCFFLYKCCLFSLEI